MSPAVPGLRFQAVHADDVADAYRRAVLSDVSGPFNIAADPVIGNAELSRLLDARPVPVPAPSCAAPQPSPLPYDCSRPSPAGSIWLSACR